jgi:hypothetical protein
MFRRMVLGLVVLGVAACATFTSGSRETIHIDSKPGGATATISCENGFHAVETTPAAISIARKAGECTVRVTKDGFEEAVIAVTPAVNPAYFLNLWTIAMPVVELYQGLRGNPAGAQAAILFGVARWGVDPLTGAIHRHLPSVIDSTLQPKVKP